MRRITIDMTNDIWIAANALKHGLALYSFDGHFQEIDGLLLLSGERKSKA